MPSRASCSPGGIRTAIESMRMEGTYPGSTYDPKQCPFWPALFRKNGYHTAQIGKWHTGTDAGFGRDWDYQIVWNRPKHPENAGAYYEEQILAFNGEEQTATATRPTTTRKWAVEYIKGEHRDKDKPWFLWLCYGSVHGPSKPAARHKGHVQGRAGSRTPADILGPVAGQAELSRQDAVRGAKGPGGQAGRGQERRKVGDEAGKNAQTYADWVRQVNECVPAIDEGVGERDGGAARDRASWRTRSSSTPPTRASRWASTAADEDRPVRRQLPLAADRLDARHVAGRQGVRESCIGGRPDCHLWCPGGRQAAVGSARPRFDAVLKSPETRKAPKRCSSRKSARSIGSDLSPIPAGEEIYHSDVPAGSLSATANTSTYSLLPAGEMEDLRR